MDVQSEDAGDNDGDLVMGKTNRLKQDFEQLFGCQCPALLPLVGEKKDTTPPQPNKSVII